MERPDLSGLRAIRFLTGDDYPPLNFAMPDGELAGFNVDIARAICEQLQVGCTIQARRWDTLVDSLLSGKGDALIASLGGNASLRSRIDFTQPYYQTPARFIVRKDSALAAQSVVDLSGKAIGAIEGTAHKAYLESFFPHAALKTFADQAALRDALRASAIDAIFDDGLTESVWLAGAGSANCCKFIGGPYLESRYFGEGVGIALRKEDADLRRALDWALARMAENGVYAEIYLKHFPVSFY